MNTLILHEKLAAFSLNMMLLQRSLPVQDVPVRTSFPSKNLLIVYAECANQAEVLCFRDFIVERVRYGKR